MARIIAHIALTYIQTNNLPTPSIPFPFGTHRHAPPSLQDFNTPGGGGHAGAQADDGHTSLAVEGPTLPGHNRPTVIDPNRAEAAQAANGGAGRDGENLGQSSEPVDMEH